MSQRVLRGAPATLIGRFFDQDGTPVAALGTVTVAVTRGDGTSVTVGTPASTNDAWGPVQTAALALADAGTVDVLTAIWSDGGVARATTYHEVVGGFLFSLKEARLIEEGLNNLDRYPDEVVLLARQAVEEELEQITLRFFSRRYRRLVCSGDGTGILTLPAGDVAVVRSVRQWTTADLTGTPTVTLTGGQLAALAVVDGGGTLKRTDFGIFTDGVANLALEVELGWPEPPQDLKRAAITRLRNRLNFDLSPIPDRATSFTITEGGTFQLDKADVWSTGIPEVDAAYGRYSRRSRPGNKIPTSAPMDFDPGFYRVYRGGRGQ